MKLRLSVSFLCPNLFDISTPTSQEPKIDIFPLIIAMKSHFHANEHVQFQICLFHFSRFFITDVKTRNHVLSSS
jgi:hypothetical protein